MTDWPGDDPDDDAYRLRNVRTLRVPCQQQSFPANIALRLCLSRIVAIIVSN